MRTILISGATGFIGRHVIHALKASANGCRLIATGRNEERLKALGIEYVVHDIAGPNKACFDRLGQPDDLIHLAWDGLPNYQKRYHIDNHMMDHYLFLYKMLQHGLKRLTVAGTCFEYGLQSGCLKESSETIPRTIYGVAKDGLRRMLETLQSHYTFKLKWLRLFYTYGPGQMETSLLAQLNAAIDRGDTAFNMSPGDQLRDYMPVEEMARCITQIAIEKQFNGVCNVCSGRPVTIAHLVQDTIHRTGANMKMNLGYYPYSDYEPMAFWGDPACMRYLLEMSSGQTAKRVQPNGVKQQPITGGSIQDGC